MEIKRLNFLKFFDLLADYNDEEIENILFSLIEHRISDLGFEIDTKTVDVKNYMHGKHQDLVKLISNLVRNLLLGVPSDYEVEIITCDKYVYDICLTKGN